MWQFLKRRKRLFLMCALLAALTSGGLFVHDASRPRLNHPRLLRGVAGHTTEKELEELLGHPGKMLSGNRDSADGYSLQWDDGELSVRATFQKDGTLIDMSSRIQLQPPGILERIRGRLGL